MSNIQKTLKQKPGYVAYLTAGDGGLHRTYESLLALVDAGVGILEIGIPFSDPIADGPTIQQASQRALEKGTTLEDVLNLVKRLRQKTDIPIVLFTYYNPILAAGTPFYHAAKQAGVDGCLVVDLPLEESDAHYNACIETNIDPIFLISPSTPIERIKKINRQGHGMLYYASRKGTTGVKTSLPEDFQQKIKEIKSVATLPIVAGFGIATREMAAEVLKYADGFVVGSLLVEAVAKGAQPEELTKLAKSIDPR